MNKIKVQTESFKYPIIIENSFESLLRYFIENVNSKKVLIITDSNVGELYLREVRSIFGNDINVSEYIIPAGEKSKNINTAEKIYKKCLQSGLDRNSCIIALGGGVVGDIAGFAAATYMRGIRVIQIPTTLLAQVDSSVGGKTGVDFEGYKNIIGAFHQPSLVYVNTSTLKTLPKREFISGMAEVIKYGVIADSGFFEFLNENYNDILNLNYEYIRKVIKGCCQIKSEIVSKDEKETDIRAVLNFGHTIGHAIESASGFQLLHGECVAIGMIGAAALSVDMGLADESEMRQITEILSKFELNLKSDVDADEVIVNIKKDKKCSDNSVNMVLTKYIGNAEVYKNIDMKRLRQIISSLLH